ncbi:MAG: TRAP transporter small permease [Betaproteobacteria bacterium]|nr:TRAP transporter small permease [Betaproteobacteria bacterium]
MERLSELYGRLIAGLALVACVLLFLLMLMTCADVLLRNVALIPGMQGLTWSNELSESMLYLVTMLTAPWILRRGQHIRVDIVLVAIPRQIAWYCEWVADALALACCVVMTAYGWSAAVASYKAGSMVIKSLITPEWWALAPLPVAFGLLAIEVLFRMQRLHAGERGPRNDAVSAG